MNKTVVLAGILTVLNLPAFLSAKSVTDALSIERRSDGNYDIVCRNGSHGIATPSQLSAGAICLPAAPTPAPTPTPTPAITDPFHPGFCNEPAITHGEALAKLQLPSGLAKTLGDVNVVVRTRVCLTADGCTAWNDFPAYTGMHSDYLTKGILHGTSGSDNYYGPMRADASKYAWWSNFSHAGGTSSFTVELQNNEPTFVVRLLGNANGYQPYAGTVWAERPLYRATEVKNYEFRQSNLELGLSGIASPEASCVANGDDWTRGEFLFYSEKVTSGNPYRSYYVPAKCGDEVFKEMRFDGHVGNHCAVWRGTNFFPKTFGSNTGHLEQQWVVYSKY